MSGLFSTPFPSDGSFKEAIVTNVDPLRFTCSVRTTSGQTLNNVTWLLPTGGTGPDGFHVAPNVFDKVLICMTTGSPLIIGCIPRVGLSDSDQVSVSGMVNGVDHGNSSELKNGFSLNPNKPADFLPGDKVLTSRGGGFIGLLSSGGILLKSSNLAQIFVSKFNGLVRIVARNFYRFSDASSEVAVNIKGALYNWRGIDWDLSRNVSSLERYNEVSGHVAAGKLMRSSPSSTTTIPARDTRVKELYLKDASGNEIMVDTLYEDGKLILVVKQPAAGTTTVTQDNSLWKSQVVNGTTSTITILPGSILVNHNDISTVLLDDTQVSMNFNNASTMALNASGIQANAHGHFFVVDSAGTHLG